MTLRVINLESASHARLAWGAAPANYDIAASDPGKLNEPGLAAPGEGRPCRRIIAGVAGTVVYTGLDGVNVTLPSTGNGQVWDVQAIALVNTSTAQQVVVFW
jgi:hypothetical protein